MRDMHDARPPAESRICGRLDGNARRLLAQVDAALDERLRRHPGLAARWTVYAVLVESPALGARRGRAVIALRTQPRAGVSLADAGGAPWLELHDLACAIAARVPHVGRVVPDVAAPAPVFVERLGSGTVLDDRAIDELLSA